MRTSLLALLVLAVLAVPSWSFAADDSGSPAAAGTTKAFGHGHGPGHGPGHTPTITPGHGPGHIPPYHPPVDPYDLNRRRWAQDIRPIIVDIRDGRFGYARQGLDRLIWDVDRAGATAPYGPSPRLRDLGRHLRFVGQGLMSWNPNRRELMDHLRQIRRQLDVNARERW